jgi:8-oxo-dGTP pyrophosphatase MutT (NUDIX family)
LSASSGRTRPCGRPPGGGIEPDETPEQAIVRELAEECGLRDFDLGPCIWTRNHWFADMAGWGGQSERIYLVGTEAFEPTPEWMAEQLAAEGIRGRRWWAPEELATSRTIFAPRRLPELLGNLSQHGPPSEPVDVGV